MYVDTEHKVVACLPAKAGCTAFKGHLLANSKHYKNIEENPTVVDVRGLSKFGIHRLSEYNKTAALDILKTYTKVMVVRHPLVRLYSAYRAKFTGGAPGQCRNFQRRFGSKIVQEQRHKKDPCPKDITFKEFARYFADKSRQIKRDPHWREMEITCQPCHVQYDHVLRLETGTTDAMLFVSDILNKNKAKPPASNEKAVRLNNNTNFSEQKLSEQNFEQTYVEFKGIHKNDVEKLKQTYEMTSTLFGYDSVLTKEGLKTTCRYENKNGEGCC